MKHCKIKPSKTTLYLLLAALLVTGVNSTNAYAQDCEGVLEMTFPEWISSTLGETCCSDPRGFKPDGEVDENLPSDPPGDGLWEKATNLDNCGDCEVLTTYEIFNAQGAVIASNAGSPDSHAADETSHRI